MVAMDIQTLINVIYGIGNIHHKIVQDNSNHGCHVLKMKSINGCRQIHIITNTASSINS